MALFRGLLLFFIMWALIAPLLMVITKISRRQALAMGKLLLYSGLSALLAAGILYLIVIIF